MSRSLGKAEKAAKPAAMEQYVTLVVNDQEGRRLTRTMRRTDKLQAMMDFYHDLVPAVERGDDGVFMRCGRRILGCQTPKDCGMRDGDVIQLFPNIKPDMLVTLVLQDFRGRSLTRTMRKTERMQVLMDFYAAMVPAAGDDGDGGGVFLYRGEPVAAEQTPAGLKMADWDRIYFVPRRRGEVKEDKSVDYITVRVRDDKERMIYCTVRRSEQLKPDLYHATVLGDRASILGGAFLFDGQRLHGRHTPAQLDMEVGDMVDYLPEQI
ncbi:hypothetical protein ACQJBY_005322 [Aegilops geniculata]